MTKFHVRNVIVYLLLGIAACSQSPEEEAYKAFLASRRALEAGDIPGLKFYLVPEKAAELDGPYADMALEMARSAMPQSLDLKKAAFGENAGTLTLSGQNVIDDGDGKLAIPTDGTIRMVKKADGWKIEKEDWAIQLDRATRVFDIQPFLQEGQRPVALKVLEGHGSGATQIAHTPDWNFLITTSYGDYSIRVWDVASGLEVASDQLEDRPTSLTMSGDGQRIIVGTVDGDVFEWPIGATGRLGVPTRILEDAGRHVSISADGRWLASTSHDTPVSIYDLSTASAMQTLEGSTALRSTTFSPSGDLLVGSEGNQLEVWSTTSWKRESYTLGKVSPDSSNSPISFSRDGRYLGVPCGDSSIIIFDVDDRRVKHDFFVSGVSATAIEFSPDASVFATAQNNQQINVWGIDDHKRVGYILSKKASAESLQFSPDGRYLIAGHEDRQVVFWGVAREGDKIAAPTRPATTGLAQSAMPAKLEYTQLLSMTNYLTNPDASQQSRFWRTSGDTRIEECRAGDPCFVTQWDGKLVGTAILPNGSDGKYMLLIGSATSERVHQTNRDQTGESYIHGYGESRGGGNVRGKHYSARTLQTQTSRANQWSTLWGVFEVDQGIQKINFEIRQSDGSTAKNGSASRFDDLGVFLFDSANEAEAFVARYEREIGRVSATPIAKSTKPTQPPANPAPAPDRRATDPGSAMTRCDIDGRIIFTTAAQCALARRR